MALPNTPLIKRLESEGRLLNLDWTETKGHGSADCNFVPKLMTPEELNQGYNWLSRCLYRYDTYADRLVTSPEPFPEPESGAQTGVAGYEVHKYFGESFRVLSSDF